LVAWAIEVLFISGPEGRFAFLLEEEGEWADRVRKERASFISPPAARLGCGDVNAPAAATGARERKTAAAASLARRRAIAQTAVPSLKTI